MQAGVGRLTHIHQPLVTPRRLFYTKLIWPQNKTGHRVPAAQPRPTASSPLFSQIASRWFDIAASVARCREYRAAPQLNASGLLDHTLIA